MDSIFINLSQVYPALYLFIVALAGMTAVLFVIMTLQGAVAMVNKPPGATRFTPAHLATGLLAAALLSGFVATVGVGTDTLFGDRTATGYGGIKDYYNTAQSGGGTAAQQTKASMRAAAGLIQLLGFIALFRSVYVMRNIGLNERASGWGAAWFFIGGLALINIDITVAMMADLFGFDKLLPWVETLGA